jgi:hypothetical protein
VQFVNDTRGPVELKLCTDRTCTSFGYFDRLRIGGATEENISPDFGFTRWGSARPGSECIEHRG